MQPRTVVYSPTETGALPWHAWNRAAGRKTVQIVMDGTMTYTLQHTAGNLQDGSTVTAVDDADVAAETTGGLFHFDRLLSGSRLNITAFTSGTLTVTFLEERP